MAKKGKDSEEEEDDDPREEELKEFEARSKQQEEEIKALRQRLQDEQYQKAEVAKDYRERIAKLEDDKRKAEISQQFPPIDDSYQTPQTPPPMKTDNPPFTLVKMVGRQDTTGSTINVAQDIPGMSFNTIPRVEDVPANTLLQYGAGEYKIRDSTGRIVSSFNVMPVSPPAAPGFQVAPMNAGSLIPSRTQEAMELIAEGKRAGDQEIVKAGYRMIGEISRGGVGGDLAGELAKFVAIQNSIRSIVSPNAGMMGSPGFIPDKEVQLKQLEYDIESKRWDGIGKTADSVVSRVMEGIAGFVPKPADKNAAAEAAHRIGAQSPQQPLPTFRSPAPAPAPAPQSRQSPDIKAPPGTTVNCPICKNAYGIEEFKRHLPCPGAGAVAAPPPPQAAPVPVSQVSTMPSGKIPPDLEAYFKMMPYITGYIGQWIQNIPGMDPETVANLVLWPGVNMPLRGDDRKKLLNVVAMGYDAIVGKQELKDLISGFNQFPNYTEEQVHVFLDVAQLAGIMKHEDVIKVNSIGDLGPAVDEFRNHMAVQLSPQGREWICRCLNAVALKAGKPAPHPEFMTGATAGKQGRETL